MYDENTIRITRRRRKTNWDVKNWAYHVVIILKFSLIFPLFLLTFRPSTFINEAVNACTSGVCLFGGTCVNNQFNFVCLCTLGRAGPICELEDAGKKMASFISLETCLWFCRSNIYSHQMDLNRILFSFLVCVYKFVTFG